MLCMCYSSKWLASFVGSIAQEQEEKIPTTTKSMGNRKKLEALKESVLKSIKLVSTFSAKLSCALVLASHHGGHWHLGQVHARLWLLF